MPTTTIALPPNAPEAEQAYLGSVMQARLVKAELAPEHFYFSQNRTVFEHLIEALREGEPVEPIAFSNYLESRKVLDKVGGRSYVMELYTKVPSPVLVDHYEQILKEKYLLRQVIDRCGELVRTAYEAEVDVPDLLEQTQQMLTEIILKSQESFSIRHIKEGKEGAIAQLERAWENRDNAILDGIATGFYDFDRMTTGLVPGNYVVLGARPSQGKTSLALNIAAHVALTNQTPVAFFSLEMSYEQLWQRLLAFHARVSRQRWRDGLLGHISQVMPGVKEKAEEIAGAKLWIDDTPGLSVQQFRSRARLMKLQHDVQMLIVDYLQIMKGSQVRGGKDPRIEVNEISATMKAVAKELGVVVIGCAQLNRNTEERDRIFGKPRTSDLKESGALEQDADVVALLWRPIMHVHGFWQKTKLAYELKLADSDNVPLYTIDKENGKLAEKQELSEEQMRDRDERLEGYAELIVVKQRDGPVGNVQLRFVKDQTRFVNVTKKEISDNPEEQQQNLLRDEPKQMTMHQKMKQSPAPAPEEMTVEEIKEIFPNSKEIPNGEQPF